VAVAFAEYSIISVEVGFYDLSGDPHVYKNWTFGKLLESKKLNIPDTGVELSDAEGLSMAYVFVGDKAFALSEHVQRPFPNITLTRVKRIKNYRLSKARRIVECTFRILANQWRIHHRSVYLKPDLCDSISKACCVLHNYVRKNYGISVR
jgi:hypothetical protein